MQQVVLGVISNMTFFGKRTLAIIRYPLEN